jgi:hypothetical protein
MKIQKLMLKISIIISLPVWTEAEDSKIKERVNRRKATDKENRNKKKLLFENLYVNNL